MDQKYDAFISYKHGDLDGAIALKLQTLLEHLRVPSSSKSKVKKIERIFLDTGELSSSADFVQQVEGALKGADWLIVLCSPGSKASPWCKLEIDTFLKYHDMSHILLLLTEGEPDDVFPDRLLAEEMNSLHILAADARGKTKKEALKNLKKEAVYKLAATMLGLTYDDLKQRRKTYVMQRVAAASAAAFIILACFTGYIIYQSSLVTKNYNKAQKNQARYMTTISNTMLTSGDRDTAVLAANAITPENILDGPVVPEQFYALNRALGSFKGKNEYLPTAKIATGETTSYAVTADQKYACTLQEQKFTALSNASEETTWTLSSLDAGKLLKDYLLAHPEMLLPDTCPDEKELDQTIQTLTNQFAFSEMFPYKASQIFLYSDRFLLLVDLENQSLIYCREIGSGKISLSDNTVLVCRSNHIDNGLFVYNAQDGGLLHSWNIEDLMSEEDDQMPDIRNAVLSQDGTKAVVSFYVNELSASLGKKAFTGTVLFDLETGKKEIISEKSCASAAFTDQNTIGMITEMASSDSGIYEDIDNYLPEHFMFCLYDIQKHAMSLEKDWKDNARAEFSLIEELTLSILGEEKSVVLFGLNNDLILVDPDDGTVLLKLFFHNEIVNAAKYTDHSFLVALTTGRVQEISLSDYSESYMSFNYSRLNTDVKSFSFLDQADKFLFFTDNHVIYCQNKADPYYQDAEMPDYQDLSIEDVDYVTGSETCWRVVYMNTSSDLLSKTAFSIYKTGEAAPLYSWKATDGYEITNLQFREVDGHLMAACVESGRDVDWNESYILHKIDVTDGCELFAEDVSEYFDFNTNPAYGKDFTSMTLNRSESEGGGLAIVDISGDGIGQMRTIYDGMYEFDTLVKSGDGGAYLLIGRRNMTYGDGDMSPLSAYGDGAGTPADHTSANRSGTENMSLLSENISDTALHAWIFDCNTEELTELPFTENDGLSNFAHIKAGNVGFFFFVKLNETASFLVNSKNPENVIPLADDIDSDVAFFDQDRYLIYISNKVLYLYDVEKQKIISSFQDRNLDLEMMKYGKIIADDSGTFFALNDPMSIATSYVNDDGQVFSPMYTFYVDKNKSIYLYAKSQSTYISPAGNEIVMSYSNGLAYTSIYSYADLCQHEKDLLGNKTLSDLDLQALLTAD